MLMRTNAAAIVTLLCLAGPALAVSGCRSARADAARLTLLTRAPERGNWSPRTIRVQRGRQVTIVVRNPDTVTHSFYLPALNLSTGAIRPGDVREVTFTPEVAGEYLFMCTIWCSDYHMYERGTLIVE
ncbi:MAG: hypothetical protein AMS18_12870 [Gemmatimonas sp. SG8_17]|nr:MAG: hypothetical protein AMS18_12870 [Gemmatimonas sp. SG8_17]